MATAYEPERWTVLVLLAGVVLLTSGGINDTFVLPKATLLYIAAAVLVGLLGWRFATNAIVELPATRLAWLAGVVVALMAVATFANDHIARSVFGEYGRSAGLLTYAAAVVVLLAMLLAFDVGRLQAIATTLVWTTAVVVATGALHLLGVDLVPGNDVADRVVATLGQTNFVAGFLGVALPFAVWGLLHRSAPATRWAAAGTVLLAPVVALGSKSFQVLPATAASLAVTTVLLLADRWPRRRLVAALGAVLLGVVVVVLAFSGTVADELDASFNERLLFWEAGAEMVADAPILGQGPSGYATEFARYRDAEHAARFGPFQLADSPHDVPLSMFVSGGVLLGIAYLGLVAFTGWRLVVAVRRRAHLPDPTVLAAFAGAWVGYQVQSLVSIDVPTFVVLHLVVAGGLVLLSGDAERRQLALPWSPQRQRRRPDSRATAMRVVVVVSAVLLAWFGTQPLRADRAFVVGLEQRANAQSDQEVGAAIGSLRDAADLAPWVGAYWAQLAAAAQSLGDSDTALDAGRRAADAAPSTISYALSAAQLAHRLGDDELAQALFDQAEPYGRDVPQALVARAEFLVQTDRAAEAIPLVERAVDLGGELPDHLVVLARAHESLGDETEATMVWRRILELQPGNAAALEATGQAPK